MALNDFVLRPPGDWGYSSIENLSDDRLEKALRAIELSVSMDESMLCEAVEALAETVRGLLARVKALEERGA
jgi:hypothetical protein